MKWSVALMILSFSVASLGAEPAWYDEEIFHNTVHNLVELMETPRVFTFRPGDSEKFKAAFKVMQKAADRVHDQLEDHLGLEAVQKAFAETEIPLQQFMVAARENQLESGKRTLHLDDTLAIVATHAELKFWMTPAEAHQSSDLPSRK